MGLVRMELPGFGPVLVEERLAELRPVDHPLWFMIGDVLAGLVEHSEVFLEKCRTDPRTRAHFPALELRPLRYRIQVVVEDPISDADETVDELQIEILYSKFGSEFMRRFICIRDHSPTGELGEHSGEDEKREDPWQLDGDESGP